jgi:predicted nucleic acid-binding protein
VLNSILIDAGPLIALFDRDDKYHERVKAFIKDKPYQFVTTEAVLTEVSYMLSFNINAQLDFFEWVVNKGVDIQEIETYDLGTIIEMIRKYQDLPMDFADATLILAAERTDIETIISIDSDFDVYRVPGNTWIRNIFPR